MNIGKLYENKKYFLLLCPSKDIAVAAAYAFDDAPIHASDYWSKRFNCNVSYIAPKGIFCLLKKDGKYCKVLTTNGELGWIKYPENKDWTKGCIEEVNT